MEGGGLAALLGARLPAQKLPAAGKDQSGEGDVHFGAAPDKLETWERRGGRCVSLCFEHNTPQGALQTVGLRLHWLKQRPPPTPRR